MMILSFRGGSNDPAEEISDKTDLSDEHYIVSHDYIVGEGRHKFGVLVGSGRGLSKVWLTRFSEDPSGTSFLVSYHL